MLGNKDSTRNNFKTNSKGFFSGLNFAWLADVDWVLVSIVFLLCTFGIAFLASSLSIRSASVFQSELFKQIFYGLGLGVLFGFVAFRTDYHWLIKNKNVWLILNFLALSYLALFAVYSDIRGFRQSEQAQFLNSFSFLPIRPHSANGSIRWLDVPFLPNFQPSEFTKLAVLIFFAGVLQNIGNDTITWQKLKPALWAVGGSVLMIILQPDLGTSLLIIGIVLSIMWTCKVPVKIVTILASLGLIFAIIFSLSAGYRRERINNLFNLEGESAQQIRNVRFAIAGGGWFGQGYGNGEYKQANLLFEPSTDAILGVIGEEMGFVWTFFFLSLYILFLWRGTKIAMEAKDIGGRAIATGITVWIVSQAFINILGIIGILPLKGFPLPFVSQGGSAMLINLIAVGVLLNVASQSDLKVVIGQKPKNMVRK
jgi:cell division protein FtsW (lipid II flippase)